MTMTSKVPQIDPHVRVRLVHALTVADRRQKTNPYALAHYCAALQSVDAMVAKNVTLREAIKRAYCGRLVAQLIKAAGLTPLSEAEISEIR